MRTRAIGLLVALALTACSDTTPSPVPASSTTSATSATPATPSPTPTPGPSVDIPERRFVPKVQGRILAEATAHLERRGFQVKADTIELSSCVPDGLVLRQDPPARAIRDVGSRVTLGINSDPGSRCGLDLPPAAPDLQAAGEAFVRFSRGGPADEALLRTPVDLYLGGRLLHTIPGWRAVHRNSYGWLCPAAGSYSAISCPLSSTRTMSGYPGPIAVTSAPPRQPCSVGGTLAEKRARTVTLTPDESRSCFDYFAVELEIGTHGRLVAVNLIVSDP